MKHSRYCRFFACVLTAAFVLAAMPSAYAQTANPAVNSGLSGSDTKVIDAFNSRVKDYLALQHAAPSDAHIRQTKDIADMERRRTALKQAVRQARPNAKQGDIFDGDASQIFKRLLASTLSGPNGARIRSTLEHAEPIAAKQEAQLSVNADFPNHHGQPLQSAPGSLLQNLPPLPRGIEYRVVGRTLVLRDPEANLVVDYLPNALP